MGQDLSLIETQFPVSKLSKESYKERRAGSTQTLTKLGKWWGRKPLILVRATILGCVLPASGNPKKDTDIFMKLLCMDEKGLEQRKQKSFSGSELYRIVSSSKALSCYKQYFDLSSRSPRLYRDAPREDIELAAFRTLSYDAKLSMCCRPENTLISDEQTWNEVNHHLGTSAHSLEELVNQLSEQRFGHNLVVGDCFCGGGSIPFEACRIGCDSFGSDLNPIAGLLTWASANIGSVTGEDLATLNSFQNKVFQETQRRFKEYDVEDGIEGTKDTAYLYCAETVCPECGVKVPLSPTWVIGQGTKTIARWERAGDQYIVNIKMGASSEEMKAANRGTISSRGLVCPSCGKVTPISALRHDRKSEDGEIVYGLRWWTRDEYEGKPEDVFQERLYAVKYETPDGKRHYRAPNDSDIRHEQKIRSILAKHFQHWQEEGLIPTMQIEEGYNSSQLIRERGWKYWHQVFNPRQILEFVTFQQVACNLISSQQEAVLTIINLNRALNFNSKLCRWRTSGDAEHNTDTFYNQALNTVFNYGARPIYDLRETFLTDIPSLHRSGSFEVGLLDARDVDRLCDFWITDPPYADAVNYHELSEFFLSWDKKLLDQAFPAWYADSKRVLAVRGGENFSQTMIDIYSNLASHMPDNGIQVVMFTHSNPAVWAQLAIIMWKSGLKVTAAWNIATETDASGLKNGNYVKGTVLLVLRKRTGDDFAFLDEINADIRNEVKNQIASMQVLDDKEEPNFSDPDYVLAAYAASLKVLTSYSTIEDLDLDYELNQAISNPSGSKIVQIIEAAKKIAYDCVIPQGFEGYQWRDLSNAEKFYIKGLEGEKRGDYSISTYQEFARGFSIGGYSQLMGSEKANTARLKTPVEMAGRTMGDVPDFEHSIMRVVFHGIYVGVREDMNPAKALGFVKNELANYWDRREMICQILKFLVDIKNISNMQAHWGDSATMAELLLAAVTHDSV